MDIPLHQLNAPGSAALAHHSHGWRRLLLALAGLLLSGCSVFWISAYDKEAADRTTEISKQVIKFYQEMLAIDPGKRKAALGTTMASREGDVESLMRVHLLKEEARQKNSNSIRVARNMLDSWRAFAASHRSADKTALGDETLDIERGVMERHLRSAFVAEEAKKLASAN